MLAATSDGSRLSELGPSMQIGWYFANASIAAAPETIVVLVGMLISNALFTDPVLARGLERAARAAVVDVGVSLQFPF